jgi:carbon storage regulator CsrA
MRRSGEEVVITLEDGRKIVVLLVNIDRNRARIGIEAPRSIEVDRREIWQRKHPEVEAKGNVA